MTYVTPSDWLPGRLVDSQIRQLAEEHGMITPFIGSSIRKDNDTPVLSYGLSAAGYDVRLGSEIKVRRWTPTPADPKDIKSEDYDTFHFEDYFTIDPGQLVLATTVESFKIPQDVQVTAITKSTYARLGIIQLVTPIEPGQTGEITLELYNAGCSPTKIYIGEGIAQFLFDKLSRKPDVPYDVRGGKYMDQKGVTLSRI